MVCQDSSYNLLYYFIMEDVKKDIKEINEKLDKLSKHIDFIERTYSMVRSPLSYVCDKLSGNKVQNQLPQLGDSNNKIG